MLLTAAVLTVPGTAQASVSEPTPVAAAPEKLFDANAGSQFTNWFNGKCMEVLDYATHNGAPVGQWDCYGGDNQGWYALDWWDGSISLANVYSGKCLEVLNYATHNGAPVGQWDCYDGDNQKWYPRSGPDGAISWVNVHSGKCLEVLNYATHNGAPIGQWECYDGDNQQWY